MTTQQARTSAAIIATVALCLLAAACGARPASGGPAGSSNTNASTIAQTMDAQKALAFARCMRSQGVSNFPDPSNSAQFNKATLAQLANGNSRYPGAARTCQHLLPIPTVVQQRNEAGQALQFSRCMRIRGVTNFPDPGGDGRIPDPGSFEIDQGSPRFEAANQACATYRPPYIPSNAAYNAYAQTHRS